MSYDLRARSLGQVRSLRFGSTFFVRQSQTAVAFPGAFLCFGGDYENALRLIGCSKYQHAVDLIWGPSDPRKAK